jgi:hypothetical protein
MLSSTQNLAQDYSELRAEPKSLLVVETFTSDLLPPRMTGFSFNASMGEMTLVFNEPIRSSSFVFLNHFSFVVDANTTAGLSVEPSGVNSNGITQTFKISKVDLDRLKLYDGLFTSVIAPLVVLGAGLVLDTNSNMLLETGVPVITLYDDVVTPEAIYFEVNMDTGLLVFYFSEPMRVSSFNASKVSLQNTSTSTSIALSGGIVSEVSKLSMIISMRLLDSDYTALQALGGWYASNATSFTSISSDTASDAAGNGNDVAVLQARKFTSDQTAPELISFNLDISSAVAQLTLKFSEPINSESFNASALFLQLKQNASLAQDKVRCSSGAIVSATSSSTLAVNLTMSDLDAFKLNGVALNASTAWLAHSEDLIRDMAGNACVAIDGTASLPVSDYIGDDTRPQLSSWSLNMDTGELLLTFDEPVDASTFEATAAKLQNMLAAE